jgi:ribosomal protein S18 acetylase RimI-like enzyme
MLEATIVATDDELLQVHHLNQQNLKQNLDKESLELEGFVNWLYSLELLKKMYRLSPSIIIKEERKVIGYALTTLKESEAFHPDLEIMFHNLETVQYKSKPLSSYHFYCMGQICVAKGYRGKGIVNMLYQKHKEVYSGLYDFLLTEISTGNHRSLKAHRKIGFKSIYTYSDSVDGMGCSNMGLEIIY